MRARMRGLSGGEVGLRLGLTCVCAVLAGVAARAEDRVVYHDALAADWANWSWSASVNFGNPAPAIGGSGTSISVLYSQPWAGLFLHSDSPALSSLYTAVRFSIHGGSGGQSVQFWVYDASNSASARISLSALGTTWVTTTVSFGQLGVSSIGGARLAGRQWSGATHVLRG